MGQDEICLHGTCLSVGDAGVLLLGGSGTGKSDLALRLIDQPGFGTSGNLTHAELVADDQVVITRRGRSLVASPPPAIHGKLEIRGLGIVTLATRPSVTLALVVKLRDRSAIERLPGLASHDILGLAIPLVEIDGTSHSAPARIRAALAWLKQPDQAQ